MPSITRAYLRATLCNSAGQRLACVIFPRLVAACVGRKGSGPSRDTKGERRIEEKVVSSHVPCFAAADRALGRGLPTYRGPTKSRPAVFQTYSGGRIAVG